MAFSLDASLQYPTGTGFLSKSPSTNYTCGAGTQLLILGVTDSSGMVRKATIPTYGGIPFKQINILQRAASAPEVAVEMWYLLSPSTGAAYQVLLEGDVSMNKQLRLSSWKTSYGPAYLDVSAGANATAANPSLTLNASYNGLVISIMGDGGASIPTAFSNGRAQRLLTADHGAYTSVMSYFYTTTKEDASIWYTIASDDYGHIAAAFSHSDAPIVGRTWGGILKYYNGASWVECPSNNFKIYKDSSWIICPSSNFKIYRSEDTPGWYPVRFQG